MTYQELIDLLINKLKERPELGDKKVKFFADIEDSGAYYALDKIDSIYVDDGNTVNIDITREVK
jgi:hypothetical protein